MKQFTDEQVDANVSDAIRGATVSAGDDLPTANDPPEMREAKELARRYRLPFVNLLPQDGESPIDYSLLSEVPVDLMVRHQFVPLRRENGKLYVAMADPTDLDRLDDLAGALRTRIVPAVATAGAIDVVLRKGDATQRVLQEAASGFRISLVRETEQGEEVLDLDRLATDSEMSNSSIRSFTMRWSQELPTFISKRATRKFRLNIELTARCTRKSIPSILLITRR
jgi:hypothetical protein